MQSRTVHSVPVFSYDFFLFNIACPLRCQNGGTLDTGSCTCDCADGYSGSTCGGELQMVGQ